MDAGEAGEERFAINSAKVEPSVKSNGRVRREEETTDHSSAADLNGAGS